MKNDIIYELRLHPIKFTKRLLISVINFGSGVLLALIILFLLLNDAFYMFVFVMLFIIYTIANITKVKIYIFQIIITKESVVMHYQYMFKQKKKYEIDVNSLKIKRLDSVKGGFLSNRIIFYENDKKLLTQYTIGSWDKDKFIKLIEVLKNIKNP